MQATGTSSERYMVATGETGDLRPRGDDVGAVDLLIAAGWLAQRNRTAAILGAGLCRLRAEVDAIAVPLAGAARVDRAELLGRVRSFRGVRAQLVELATLRASRVKGVPLAVVPTLVDRCLDVFLDPGCRHCNGLGFTGGDGLAKRVWCRPCGKSGLRRGQIGVNEAERNFAADLLEAMDKASRFAGSGLAKMLE